MRWVTPRGRRGVHGVLRTRISSVWDLCWVGVALRPRGHPGTLPHQAPSLTAPRFSAETGMTVSCLKSKQYGPHGLGIYESPPGTALRSPPSAVGSSKGLGHTGDLRQHPGSPAKAFLKGLGRASEGAGIANCIRIEAHEPRRNILNFGHLCL